MAKALNVSLAVTADTGQAKAQLQQLQQSLQQLTTSSANLKIGISANEIQKASQAALELSAHLKTATNVNTGTLDFTKLNSSIKSSGQSLETYGQQLIKLGPQGKQAFMQLAQSVTQSEIPIKRLSGLLGNFGTVLANTVRWQLSSSMIHGFMGAIQSAYGYAQDLNKSLNNIQIVTQASDAEMSRFAVTANKAAKALSTTTTSYTDAALIYYQQGIRDEKEIAQRTDATIKMANVTGQTAQKVSDQMTAIWNNFADGSTNLEYYADVITALGAATASSSEEISRGLEKFAAIADTVGLSYENATAALATITATTRQSADTVGTGLRTLFSRLQSLSLGETLEDGVNLTKYSKALQTVGVEVLDATGNLRRMDDILLDLGDKWDGLTKAQQTALAQTVGGVRQYTTLVALMDNIDFYKENLEVAKNSEGTLERQQQIYEKSWAAAAKRVRASAESIYSNLIDDTFFTKLTDNFAKFLDIINQIISGLGGVKGILLSLGGALTSTFSNQVAGGLYKFGVGIRDLFTSPKALATKRESFIANAAGVYAGLPIDPKTGYIQGATFDKTTGQLNLSNVKMSGSQRQAYDMASQQLAIQQAYSRNNIFMSPAQQQAALMAMDRQSQTANAYLQAQQMHRSAQLTVGEKIGNLYEEIIASTKSGSIGERITNGTLTMDDAASELDRARQDFENLDQEYAKILNTLEGMREGRIVAHEDQFSEDQQLLLGLFKGDHLGNLDNRYNAIKEARDTNRAIMARQFSNMGGSTSTFSAYANAFQNAIDKGMKEEEAQKAAEQAIINAQKMAGKTSVGMKISQGMTNFAGGVMSASAAQQGLESFSNVINQVNAGLISTKDAAIQGTAAVAQMAFNGMRAFSQFSAVLGPIGGAIATITTIALPYIFDWVDSLVTTPEEMIENINHSTETAEQSAISAKNAYDNLMSSFSSNTALLDSLNELTQGTLEFEQALISANNAMYALINENKLSASDWYVDSRGAVQIRDEAKERLQQESLAEMTRTQSESLAMQSLQKTIQAQNNEILQIYDKAFQQYEKNIAEKEARRDKLIVDTAETRKIWEQSTAEGIDVLPVDKMNIYQQNLNAELDELINELSSLRENPSSSYFFNNTKLQEYAKDNNISIDTLISQLMSGEFLNNELVTNGAISSYKSYFTNRALTSSINKTKLTTAEDLIIDALSMSDSLPTILNEAISKESITVPVVRQRGIALGNEEYTAEEVWNNIKLTDENLLSQTSNFIDTLVEQFLTGTEEAQSFLTDIKESAEFKALTNQRDQNKYILEKLQANLESQALDEQYDKAFEALTPDLEKRLNRIYNLNDEQAISLIKDLASSENSFIRQDLAEIVSNDFLKSQQDFLKTIMLSTQEDEELQRYYNQAAQMSLNERKAVEQIRGNFLNAYGGNTGNLIFRQVMDGLSKQSIEIKDAAQAFSFSGSNITDLAKLKSGVSSFGEFKDGSIAQQLYESILKDVGGEKGLFEELYQSEDFADGLKKLQKQLKTTGKIGAEAILEIANETELLSDLLEISDINAQGLAIAISSLESGSIDNISSALLRALSAAGEVENTLAQVYSHIDSFQQERSAQDIGKFYKGLADSIQDSLGSGMLLDAPLLQGLEEVFGSKKRADYQQLIYDLTNDNNLTPEQISDQINKNFEAEFTALQSIQERGNLSGLYEYYETKGSQTGKSMFSYNKETGQVEAVDIDKLVANGWDSEEGFIQGLIDNYGIPETFAQSMAAEYGVTNGTISQLWRQTAAKKGLGEFFTGEESILNIDDLKTFYNTYQDVLKGMNVTDLKDIFPELDFSDFSDKINDVNDLLNILQQAASKAGKSIIDLGDNFSFTADKADEVLDTKLKDAGEGGLNQFLGINSDDSSYKVEGNTFIPILTVDYQNASKQLKELGASSAEVNTFLSQMYDTGKIDQFTTSIKDANGNMQILKSTDAEFEDHWQEYGNNIAEAWDNYVQGQQEAETQQAVMNQQAEMLAFALKSAFADGPIDISFQVAEGNTDSLKSAVEQGIQSANTEIIVTANTDPVEEAINEYDGASITVTVTAATGGLLSLLFSASGYNNARGAKGFAGGKHSNGQYEGPAVVGELGEETWIHDGEADIVGQNGREIIYVNQDDIILTHAQTQNIRGYKDGLNNNLPGFSVGYNRVTWGRKGTGANAGNTKTSKYEPERYHLITRQLKDLQNEYERLDEIKENCYGTNKLEAINREIEATDELIRGQKELIREAEDYRTIDTNRLKSLLAPGEFQVDENGNLLNFEELQEKYRKAAEENKDDEHSQNVWKALQQYEETLDKLTEANKDLRDLIYQQSELALEKITTKVDLKIDFDERDLKLIEHFTKKIDDNIYDTARVLQLAGLSLDKINDKIDTTRQGINEIFENMTDSKGNQISNMTLEKFLSLSEAERDALDINHDFGKQLEEYSDDLLDYIEDLEDFKTKGIDELNEAFNELNDNIQSSMDLFNYYQDTLDNLKNIIDLQGVTISKDLRDVFQTINQTLLSNNANNIQTELVRYEKLRDVVTDLQNKLLTVTDPTLQKEWENQLKEAEEALRNSQTNLLTLWQDGLDMAKQIFEQNIDNAVREFEEQVAGAYGDLNGLQAAYDRRKEIDDFYVDDYEKYYQISKLQRQINKDLNDAAKNHNKNVKGLNILFNDLNNAREAGVELTAYDLDIFAKRYAYEKALMDLEDSRNAKQQVRLQRDANGNWGYVYTAAEDDDDLIRKQQAVEDALYEWQKATTAEANRYSDEILPKIRANLEAIAEAYKTGSDIPQNILNDTKELLSLWGPQFQKSLEDGAQTLNIAIDRYKNTSFDIFDDLNESGLAAVLETSEGIDQLLNILTSQMDTANDEMNTASINYKNQVDNLNNFFKEYGDSLGTVINTWAQTIGEDSEENKANTSQMIENAKLTFDEILSAANEFENKFMEKYEPIISRNEQFIIALNEALDALNRKEFVQGQLLPYIGSYIDPSSFASGGFTGTWGSGGRLAVLHEKENVFNADDTHRLLNAANILRSIDLSINSFATGFGNILLPNLAPIGNSLDQNVHIEASFPNVTEHNEIELAFDNLINKASQYANRKNMSSMTFQDMYTSKF